MSSDMPVRWSVRRPVGRGASVVAAYALFATLSTSLSAGSALEMRMSVVVRGAPADLRLTLHVEPHPDNRVLAIEADGEDLFTSSEIRLTGESEKRFHEVWFRSFPPGTYIVRATLYSSGGVRATATNRFVVIGADGR